MGGLKTLWDFRMSVFEDKFGCNLSGSIWVIENSSSGVGLLVIDIFWGMDKEWEDKTKSGKGSIIWSASITIWNGNISSWNMTSLEIKIYFDDTSKSL